MVERQPYSRRKRVAACVVLIVAVGCSDSTSPPPLNLAKHIDTLYVKAETRGTAGSQGYRWRAGNLSGIEIPLAYGAVPVEIDVTTARGIERWSGVEYRNTTGSIADDGYATWINVYRDTDIHMLLVAWFRSDGALRAAELTVNDTLAVDPSEAFGVSIDSTSGADCVLADGLQNPDVLRFFSTPCTLEEFRTAFTGTFPVPSNADQSLRSLSFDYTMVNGARVGAR